MMACETEGRDIPKYRANSFQNTFLTACASSQTTTGQSSLPRRYTQPSTSDPQGVYYLCGYATPASQSKKENRSRDYNARFTATHRTVSVYRVLQMRGVRVRRRTS
ncbi:MAG: hypothetical protein U9R60_05270, partial [Bacteroidota bacterium]|nr:hypothetical protein [Bacteroidota bacterium]